MTKTHRGIKQPGYIQRMAIGATQYNWNTGVEWTEGWKGKLVSNWESSLDCIPIAEGVYCRSVAEEGRYVLLILSGEQHS